MNRNMMRQAQKQLAQLQKIQDELETLLGGGERRRGGGKDRDDRQADPWNQ